MAVKIKPGPLVAYTKKRAVRFLSRAGAYVRGVSRRSIRKRKKPAPPGKSPSSHTGQLRGMIRFTVNENELKVTIGPDKLNKKYDVPSILEFGGMSGTQLRKKEEKVYVQPRPFMRPALGAAIRVIDTFWQARKKR